MSNHSVIEHRANYHYIKVEEDLIAICIGGKANPHCKALILAILEGWTNTKRDKGEDPAIYMTYPQWIRATYWLFGRNVIIEALDELVSDGFIGRRDYRTHGKDTFIYTLNVKAVQDAIRDLPEKKPDDYLPSFNLNAFKNKRVRNQTRPKSNGKTEKGVYYQTADAFNKGRNIEYSTNLQSNITSERESTAPESDTPVSPPSVGDSRAISPQSENHSQQGDAHADIPLGSRDRVGTLPSAGVGGNHHSAHHRPLVAPATEPVLEAGEEIAVSKQNTSTTTPAQAIPPSPEQAAPGHCFYCPDQAEITCQVCGKHICYETHGRVFPLQDKTEYYCLPCLEAHNKAVTEALRQKESAQQNHSAGTPNGAAVGDDLLGNPPAQGAASPKWGIEAMVADAERLRDRPFSAIARPKETKKAQVLFKRKPDLTQEEFEAAWKNWDTDWWRKTNGPFTLTDLAATPKDKSEMRLILALEKLALAKANPRQSSQFVSVPRVRVFSSYDDPNFRSDQDFYPVEGGSYATAVV